MTDKVKTFLMICESKKLLVEACTLYEAIFEAGVHFQLDNGGWNQIDNLTFVWEED